MQAYEITPFHLRAATDADYACLNEFRNVLRLEAMPEDPPVSLLEDVRSWRSLPTYIEESVWVAREVRSNCIIAVGEAEIYNTGDNPHMLNFNIEVLPEYRRRGLARQMLALIVDHARRNDRRLMLTEAGGRVPAAAKFLTLLGGRKGLDAHVNQLRIRDLDRGLLQRWLDASSRLSASFRLGFWDDRYPESRMQELADLMQVVGNDQPRDTLDVEDSNYTPDIIRQFESLMLAGGSQRWSLYAADRDGDRVAGITEVLWHPDRPAILSQAFTGVLPRYRGKGLGRWLKAEMLNRVLSERPQVQVIRTGNANSNGPMLNINTELGFQPYVSRCIWQVETEAAAKYLASRP